MRVTAPAKPIGADRQGGTGKTQNTDFIRSVSRWRLQVLRIDRGLTNQDLADRIYEACGIRPTTQTVSNWQKDPMTAPRLAAEFWDALPLALDSTLTELWADYDESREEVKGKSYAGCVGPKVLLRRQAETFDLAAEPSLNP